MKTFVYIFFFLITSTKVMASNDFSLEIKAGNYYFLDKRINKIFQVPNYNFHVQLNYQLFGPFLVFFDTGILRHSSHVCYEYEDIYKNYYKNENSVKLNVQTVSFGIKYMHFFNCYYAVYCGLAPTFYDIEILNNYRYLPKKDQYKDLGASLEMGIHLKPIVNKPNLFLELFSDCHWATFPTNRNKMSSITNDINMSGINFGIAVGSHF